MSDMSLKRKIRICCGVAIIVIISPLAVISPLSLYTINKSIALSVEEYGRKDYEEKKSELISKIDSFININHRLPVSLSEIGLQQNTLTYDIDGVYYVTLIPDDPSDNSYILKYGYYIDSSEYYLSKIGEWVDADKVPTPFIENDTLKKIDEIKIWMSSEFVVSNIDSICPNTSISFGYKVWEDDSLVYINKYKKSNGTAMKGWAVVGRSNFLWYKEFGDWEYRDKDGNVYHKFWNYRMNDSLIYRPDPILQFIKPRSHIIPE